MKFGVPWRAQGARPEPRETAMHAARRAGLPLGDWLKAVILKQQAAPTAAASDDTPHREDLASVHQRLDDLAQRIERMTRSGPAAYAPPPRRARGDAGTPGDLVDRFDRRLDRFADGARTAPPLAPTPNMQLPPSLDRALVEIAARQRALNGEPAPAAAQPKPQAKAPVAQPAPRPAPPPAPAPAALAEAAPAPIPAPAPVPLPVQNISGLEEQLRRITDQIETLRKPGVEEAINALRGELIDIGNALNEAMPRREIEAIEKQIAGLSQRIAEGRQNGVDHDQLSGIEQGLVEVRDALRGLTPAEQLVGFHDAVDGLARKIDLIVAQKDPETMAQLESAIATLRDMAAHVASGEAVSSLAAEVQLLGQKVDYIAHATTASPALDNLEQRVSAIADALAQRAQNGGAVPPRLETLVQSLADKIEQLQASRGDDVAVGHLEDRIVKLVEKLDASESRLGQLEAIERGLGDLLVHVEELRANREPSGLRAENSPAVDELKHEIARTQDAVDSVHGTLALVVDRLAKIEADLRASRTVAEETAAAAPPRMGKLAVRAVSDAPSEAPSAPPIAPQPAPQTAPAPAPEPARLPKAASLPMPQVPAAPAQPAQGRAAAPVAPHEPLELHESQIARPAAAAPPPPPPSPPPRRRASLPLEPDLPPDQPLEPGSGRPQFSARIAASEAALGAAAPAPAGTAGGKSSFIAAARRAAQAALQQAPSAPPPHDEAEEFEEPERRSLSGKLMKRMKSLFVAAGIIGLVGGGAQILGHNFYLGHNSNSSNSSDSSSNGSDSSDSSSTNSGSNSGSGSNKTAKTGRLDPDDAAKRAREVAPAPLSPDRLTTGMVPPLAAPLAPPTAPAGTPATAAPLSPQQPAGPAGKNDITGSIGHSVLPPAVPGPQATALPIAIGGAKLREAALAGNGAAAYEVGTRFAEGRGVPANMKDAAHWFERAASAGLAPAQFRYASMLEKGLGVKKDLAAARRLYLAAAGRGNAKAMHNLAVLYAEGIDGKPDYDSAVKWFRKAAQHGVRDSQYNLGVLCARGLGTEKDYVESYKWFALAGAKGDAESAKKRDEVASRLPPEQLAAAELAVTNFRPEPQPAVATTVPKPHGGWDTAAGGPSAQGKGQGQGAKPVPAAASHRTGRAALARLVHRRKAVKSRDLLPFDVFAQE